MKKFKPVVVLSGQLNIFQCYRRLKQLATYERPTRAELSVPLQLVAGVQGIRKRTLKSGQDSLQENKGKEVFIAYLFEAFALFVAENI